MLYELSPAQVVELRALIHKERPAWLCTLQEKWDAVLERLDEAVVLPTPVRELWAVQLLDKYFVNEMPSPFPIGWSDIHQARLYDLRASAQAICTRAAKQHNVEPQLVRFGLIELEVSSQAEHLRKHKEALARKKAEERTRKLLADYKEAQEDLTEAQWEVAKLKQQLDAERLVSE